MIVNDVEALSPAIPRAGETTSADDGLMEAKRDKSDQQRQPGGRLTGQRRQLNTGRSFR
ncbi:hypothetical protein LCGC14_1747490 [marine sediment metagenome]|uniref:Uncharacterized protein n=1 Tax=marine sediment metagenome TaxID=412755 RepID=A0A0F9HS81_9ZZZZ